MRVSNADFNIIPTRLNSNKKQNINNQTPKSNNVAFKGQNDDALSYFALNVLQVLSNPVLALQKQLVDDGFSTEAIKAFNIYAIKDPTDTSDDIPNYLQYYSVETGKIHTGTELISGPAKSAQDIFAMCRIYNSLKKSFITPDVVEYNNAFLNVRKILEQDFGIKTPKNKEIENLILRILGYTNVYNEPVIQALLDDDNFNNVNIVRVAKNVQDAPKAKAALEVIDEIKDTGYDKKMNLPIAIMISEANSKNLPVIKKALGEQEFLTQDTDFVTQKLPRFLANYDYIAISYVKDNTMTLKDVKELMELVEL